MSYIGVFSYLTRYNLHTKMKDILVDDPSRKNVIEYLKCKEEELVNCTALKVNGNPILIVTAGNKNIDYKKFEREFNEKFKKINYNLLKEQVGHSLGGLCPFIVNKNVKVYLDESLIVLDNIYLLCGSPFAVVQLNVSELEKAVENNKWINVCE